MFPVAGYPSEGFFPRVRRGLLSLIASLSITVDAFPQLSGTSESGPEGSGQQLYGAAGSGPVGSGPQLSGPQGSGPESSVPSAAPVTTSFRTLSFSPGLFFNSDDLIGLSGSVVSESFSGRERIGRMSMTATVTGGELFEFAAEGARDRLFLDHLSSSWGFRVAREGVDYFFGYTDRRSGNLADSLDAYLFPSYSVESGVLLHGRVFERPVSNPWFKHQAVLGEGSTLVTHRAHSLNVNAGVHLRHKAILLAEERDGSRSEDIINVAGSDLAGTGLIFWKADVQYERRDDPDRPTRGLASWVGVKNSFYGFEKAPTAGTVTGGVVGFVPVWAGSDPGGRRSSGTIGGLGREVGPTASHRSAVLAFRIEGHGVTGRPPFWLLPQIGGLNGLVRGVMDRRYVGKIAFTGSVETRVWAFAFGSMVSRRVEGDFATGGASEIAPGTAPDFSSPAAPVFTESIVPKVRLGFTLFADAGTAFNEPLGDGFGSGFSRNLVPTFGGGLLLSAFSSDLVLRADVGFSREGYGVYIATGYSF